MRRGAEGSLRLGPLASRRGQGCDSVHSGFQTSLDTFHEFRIERRVRKEMRILRLNAQIVKIEQREAETRVQILPHPDYGAALY